MSYKIKRSIDGTIKIEFDEGYIAVIIPTKDEKVAVCVSCQIGCAAGCSFCFTGKMGFKKNLTHEQIVEQVSVAKEIIGKNPSSVVFMGMGEPSLNLKNVLQAGELIHKKFNISYNKITISTSCLKNIGNLVNIPFNLALSLHSPFNDVRKKIVPIGISVDEIVEFSKKYVKNANNKKYIMISYTVVKGLNDSEKDLEKLISLDWPKKTFFNIIELNELENNKKPKEEVLLKFKEKLISKGWKCFIRHSRGADIKAACGMLEI